MKILTLILLFIVTAFSVKCQVGIGKKYDCVQVGNLTSNQRLSKYPFNKAYKIQILSFSSEALNLPLVNGSLDWNNVKDSITLSRNQIDSLTNLLFNFGCTASKIVKSISTAVAVDIAIVFIGASNELIDYIDICFDCREIDLFLSKGNKKIGMPCNQRLDRLKQFSQAWGLQL
jgi:hypothetical protein